MHLSYPDPPALGSKSRVLALCAALILVVTACGGSSDSTADTGAGTSDGSALPSQCTGPCSAATPAPPILSSAGGQGNVTMYSTSASSGGACGYGATNIQSYAAINVHAASGDGQGQWQRGKVCGQCAEVTVLTSEGLKPVTVRIVDKCPDGNCGIDLGGRAPEAVMADGFGRYAGQWRFVSCNGHPEVSDGPPTLNVKDGSNPWWSRVRVHNPATGVASIDYQDTSSSARGSFVFDATNVEYAYEVPTSAVLQSKAASFLITVTYVDGTKASVQLTPAQLGTASASYPLR
jgi:expansin (peptidoglycan-binding protein)